MKIQYYPLYFVLLHCDEACNELGFVRYNECSGAISAT